MVQVRFKTTPREERLELGRALRALTREHGALLVVNDHPDLAAELGADGVHLGAGDPPVDRARDLLGPGAIIGVSAYDRRERITSWTPERISYIGLSSPYTSPTKEKAIPAPGTFRSLVASSRVPVYAIGGITPERTAAMLEAGCHGVAAVSSIYGAPDPAGRVARVLDALP